MPESPVPLFSIAECVPFRLIPDLCLWGAKKLEEVGSPGSSILFFEVRETLPPPNERMQASEAPERLICVTSGLPARQLVHASVLAFKKRQPPRVARVPDLDFEADLTMDDVFRELDAADNTVFALLQEAKDPYTIYFMNGALTVSEVSQELTRRLM